MKTSILSIAVLLAGSCAALAAEPATERTAQLARFEQMRYGMFLCFGMPPFAGQWDYPKMRVEPLPPSSTYAPKSIDAEQWIATAAAAGMKYAVLTTKHNVGHCLWDSQYTDYDVATSGNHTDVVAEFVAACRRHDVAPGLYYNLGKDVAHLREKAMSKEQYAEFAINQVRELLTRYGPIFLLWFDAPGGVSADARAQLYDVVKSLQPDCLVLMNHGTKDDGSQLRNWPTDLVNGERRLPPPEGHNPRMVYRKKTYYVPMEVCDTSAAKWFWYPGESPKPLDTLLTLYRDSTQHGANLLLSATVDTTGRIPQATVDRLVELRKAFSRDPSSSP